MIIQSSGTPALHTTQPAFLPVGVECLGGDDVALVCQQAQRHLYSAHGD